MRDEPSRTAEAVCLFRATDQRRPTDARIVDDPHAKLFLGPMARTALATIEASGRLGELAEEHTPGLLAYVLCRDRFVDDALVRALDGAIRQVVILGAGYDTRAYRFARALRGRRVYELDIPSTSRRKHRIVEEHRDELPPQPVERIEIDCEQAHIDDALFAADTPTFLIREGAAMYLSRAAVKDTLARIRALCAPGSVLAMDYWFLVDAPDLVSTAYRMSPNLLHLVGEPITFSLHSEDARPFMQTLGYEIADLSDGEALRRRYVRDGRHVYPGNYVLEARVV